MEMNNDKKVNKHDNQHINITQEDEKAGNKTMKDVKKNHLKNSKNKTGEKNVEDKYMGNSCKNMHKKNISQTTVEECSIINSKKKNEKHENNANYNSTTGFLNTKKGEHANSNLKSLKQSTFNKHVMDASNISSDNKNMEGVITEAKGKNQITFLSNSKNTGMYYGMSNANNNGGNNNNNINGIMNDVNNYRNNSRDMTKNRGSNCNSSVTGGNIGMSKLRNGKTASNGKNRSPQINHQEKCGSNTSNSGHNGSNNNEMMMIMAVGNSENYMDSYLANDINVIKKRDSKNNMNNISYNTFNNESSNDINQNTLMCSSKKNNTSSFFENEKSISNNNSLNLKKRTFPNTANNNCGNGMIIPNVMKRGLPGTRCMNGMNDINEMDEGEIKIGNDNVIVCNGNEENCRENVIDNYNDVNNFQSGNYMNADIHNSNNNINFVKCSNDFDNTEKVFSMKENMNSVNRNNFANFSNVNSFNGGSSFGNISNVNNINNMNNLNTFNVANVNNFNSFNTGGNSFSNSSRFANANKFNNAENFNGVNDADAMRFYDNNYSMHPLGNIPNGDVNNVNNKNVNRLIKKANNMQANMQMEMHMNVNAHAHMNIENCCFGSENFVNTNDLNTTLSENRMGIDNSFAKNRKMQVDMNNHINNRAGGSGVSEIKEHYENCDNYENYEQYENCNNFRNGYMLSNSADMYYMRNGNKNFANAFDRNNTYSNVIEKAKKKGMQLTDNVNIRHIYSEENRNSTIHLANNIRNHIGNTKGGGGTIAGLGEMGRGTSGFAKSPTFDIGENVNIKNYTNTEGISKEHAKEIRKTGHGNGISENNTKKSKMKPTGSIATNALVENDKLHYLLQNQMEHEIKSNENLEDSLNYSETNTRNLLNIVFNELFQSKKELIEEVITAKFNKKVSKLLSNITLDTIKRRGKHLKRLILKKEPIQMRQPEKEDKQKKLKAKLVDENIEKREAGMNEFSEPLFEDEKKEKNKKHSSLINERKEEIAERGKKETESKKKKKKKDKGISGNSAIVTEETFSEGPNNTNEHSELKNNKRGKLQNEICNEEQDHFEGEKKIEGKKNDANVLDTEKNNDKTKKNKVEEMMETAKVNRKKKKGKTTK